MPKNIKTTKNTKTKRYVQFFDQSNHKSKYQCRMS